MCCILVKSKVPFDEGQTDDVDEELGNNGEEYEPFEIERETLLQRRVSVRQSIVANFFWQLGIENSFVQKYYLMLFL